MLSWLVLRPVARDLLAEPDDDCRLAELGGREGLPARTEQVRQFLFGFGGEPTPKLGANFSNARISGPAPGVSDAPGWMVMKRKSYMRANATDDH